MAFRKQKVQNLPLPDCFLPEEAFKEPHRKSIFPQSWVIWGEEQNQMVTKGGKFQSSCLPKTLDSGTNSNEGGAFDKHSDRNKEPEDFEASGCFGKTPW